MQDAAAGKARKTASAISAPTEAFVSQYSVATNLRLLASTLPDGSGIAAAIDYSLNRWTPLGCFLEDGDVSCHNNHLENLMRPWAMGRKAWLFVCSELAGQRAATVMSLAQSAHMQGHDPFAYLKNVLTRLPTHPTRGIDDCCHIGGCRPSEGPKAVPSTTAFLSSTRVMASR